MAIKKYISYVVQPNMTTANRSADANLYFLCDTFAELPTGADAIDDDTAYCVDTKKRYMRIGGAWAVSAADMMTPINAGQASYRTILQAAGSHIAARVAGTYAIPNGEALAISGTGTLYPLSVIAIASADYPTINGLAPKLRIRGQIACNDVAPTGNYTFGLYPITRPATSGGAGLNTYTLGTVVAGSNGATVSAPAAKSNPNLFSQEFALPADGLYVIGVVTTATVAASAHMHFTAQLQMRNA